MTTINNDQSLIEKVGGIDRAIALEAMLQKHAVPESWKISIINGMWHRSSVGFTHSDLRTAIAKHDEFKAGDFVVLTATGTKDVLLKIIDHKYTNDLHRVKIVKTASCGPIHKDQIRHATLEEIKAGRRLEAERHG